LGRQDESSSEIAATPPAPATHRFGGTLGHRKIQGEQKMNLKHICVSAFALLLVVATILPAIAQTSKGILAGIVRDKTGAAISGAKVTLTSQDTSETRAAIADERGAYRIDAVNSGHYTVNVQAGGFQTASTHDINVVPSIVTTYDPVLTVGEVSQAVTVEANTNNINTENGQLSSTVSTAELANVPIVTLNPIELLQTVPGVQIVEFLQPKTRSASAICTTVPTSIPIYRSIPQACQASILR
jgi:hypothetical protein